MYLNHGCWIFIGSILRTTACFSLHKYDFSQPAFTSNPQAVHLYFKRYMKEERSKRYSKPHFTACPSSMTAIELTEVNYLCTECSIWQNFCSSACLFTYSILQLLVDPSNTSIVPIKFSRFTNFLRTSGFWRNVCSSESLSQTSFIRNISSLVAFWRIFMVVSSHCHSFIDSMTLGICPQLILLGCR